MIQKFINIQKTIFPKNKDRVSCFLPWTHKDIFKFFQEALINNKVKEIEISDCGIKCYFEQENQK